MSAEIIKSCCSEFKTQTNQLGQDIKKMKAISAKIHLVVFVDSDQFCFDKVFPSTTVENLSNRVVVELNSKIETFELKKAKKKMALHLDVFTQKESKQFIWFEIKIGKGDKTFIQTNRYGIFQAEEFSQYYAEKKESKKQEKLKITDSKGEFIDSTDWTDDLWELLNCTQLRNQGNL